MIERTSFLVGSMLRESGAKLNQMGGFLQGKLFYEPHLSRHRRLMPLDGIKPTVGQGAWIAPNATVIGKVDIGPYSSIWYGSVLRGDANFIRIGSKTNIQDRVIIHARSGDKKHVEGAPTIVGDLVTVEAGAILHACTLENGCKVELGAKILDGAIVGSYSVVASGSLVPSNKSIPPGELWSGSPAQFIRKLTTEEIESLKHKAEALFKLSQIHDEEHSKTLAQLEHERVLEQETKAASRRSGTIKETPKIAE